ncbi:MobF family relaxase [Mycobacterium sp. 3519A]|uniref:MobF family relaxase n=1 Tax=Mycobacterium sp. 3519A TaxID=2057184 RepID=UPI000C7C67BC|nr:MobF family relaxase [Mycobacterium sp. 3519A]
MLTIAKLSRWSIKYYNDTANAVGEAVKDARKPGGGLGEYYTEHDTRTPVWLCAGDTHSAAKLVGLTDLRRAGGEADTEVVARWLDDGVAPNRACGRAFGTRGVHGFDLTFCAPKTVSLIRALRADEVADKAISAAHAAAISEAMEYLAAHAGYTRVHNLVTGEKDLVKLPGLVAIAYQHETSRAGDPHLHTHVIVPNRQARPDGQLVSIDGASLYHEARAAGVIYQATLRSELHRLMGVEWTVADPATGMAEVAGISRDTITAWSQRSTQLRQWAAGNLAVADARRLTPAQLATAQKATRPLKLEHVSWAELRAQWRTDERSLAIDGAAWRQARQMREQAARIPLNRDWLVAAAQHIEKAAFTRADLIEIIGARLPVDTEHTPRTLVESAVDHVAVRLTATRQPHQREGHERFTTDSILAEEAALLDLVDARDVRASMLVKDTDTAGLSPDQKRAVENIAKSPWLVQPVSAPAGAGKTTSMRVLAAVARRRQSRILVLAPTGKAVDVAVREGAGDTGYTIAKALHELHNGALTFDHLDLVIVDEAGMVGTTELHQLLTATTKANIKTVLVGDAHQLAPVKARGGMFAQLCDDLPWTQKLSEVWRMHDRQERAASLALRDGGPAPVRRAIDWYRTHDRLHTGDEIAMATDALAAYRADTADGKDALLLCDTTEMADALNRRIHTDTIDPKAPTIGVARGHRVAVGDLIISRRNDPALPVLDATRNEPAADPVRNGNRWRVYAIDPEHDRVAARRLDDGARAVLTGDYLTEHITYGYAVTVHSAQGVTADTTQSVLGENSTRAMLYVAMTRGRESNTAYLFQRGVGDGDHEHSEHEDIYVARRGSSRDAAHLLRDIIATHDARARTAHDVSATTEPDHLSEPVASFVDQRAKAAKRRCKNYLKWQEQTHIATSDSKRWSERHVTRTSNPDHGIQL